MYRFDMEDQGRCLDDAARCQVGNGRLEAGHDRPHPAPVPRRQTLRTRPLRQQPGFLRCRKWKDTTNAPDGWVRYVCHYELTGQEAVERYVASDATKRLRAESDKHFGYVTRPSRAVLTEAATFG